MKRVLYLIFFASGATGLVYEVVWVRLTGLVFGNTSFSIATVLGAFMTGLALGSWKMGALADRHPRPLRLYGIIEILIGLTALLVPLAFQYMDTFYWRAAPVLSAVAGAELLVRFCASFAIMLVPTFLMGGTLPVLARFLVRDNRDVESGVGVLYALNTFGAAAGTLGAALVLIPQFGNQWTIMWIAALNMALGLLAIRLDLGTDPLPEAESPTQAPERTGSGPDRVGERLVLLASWFQVSSPWSTRSPGPGLFPP
jgi:spermidine synthase